MPFGDLIEKGSGHIGFEQPMVHRTHLAVFWQPHARVSCQETGTLKANPNYQSRKVGHTVTYQSITFISSHYSLPVIAGASTCSSFAVWTTAREPTHEEADNNTVALTYVVCLTDANTMFSLFDIVFVLQ